MPTATCAEEENLDLEAANYDFGNVTVACEVAPSLFGCITRGITESFCVGRASALNAVNRLSSEISAQCDALLNGGSDLIASLGIIVALALVKFLV